MSPNQSTRLERGWLQRSAWHVCLVAVLMATAMACASDPKNRRPHPHLIQVWRDYQEIPMQRAIAIAGDPRRTRWVTGASGGHASVDDATEGALRECRSRRQVRRLKPACVLYAIGDRIVWQGF